MNRRDFAKQVAGFASLSVLPIGLLPTAEAAIDRSLPNCTSNHPIFIKSINVRFDAASSHLLDQSTTTVEYSDGTTKVLSGHSARKAVEEFWMTPSRVAGLGNSQGGPGYRAVNAPIISRNFDNISDTLSIFAPICN